MRLPAAWMGVGLWCFNFHRDTHRTGYGNGIRISGACRYSNVHRGCIYADVAIVMSMKAGWKFDSFRLRASGMLSSEVYTTF